MTKIGDEMLAAYADGELGDEDRAEVQRAIAGDESLRSRFEAQRGLRARLNAYYDPVLEEEAPARLTAMLAAGRGAEIADLAAARERRTRLFAWPNFAAMAASLAVGIIAGQVLLSPGDGPVAVLDGALIARGELAHMLDTRLASAQPAGSTHRIGITFRDDRDRICRTFEAPAIEGIACREGAGWRLAMVAAAERASSEYRQAGASAVLERAGTMMAGSPLDASAERRARERGWRAD